MLRVRALLLLLQFSVSLIAPILASAPEPKLPPCCRRDGKHRCAMMAMIDGEESSGGPAWRGRGKQCPLYPRGWPTSAPHKQLATLPHPVILNAPALAKRSLLDSPDSRYGSPIPLDDHERGPPALPL